MPSRRAAAVVRFSSLGDVLLAAHVPSFLARSDPGGRPLLFVTKERYAPVLAGHPHLDRVLAVGEGEGLGRVIAALREARVEAIYDLHRNARSTRLLMALPGARRHLARKHALRRRLWAHARWLRPRPVPPLLRSYRALAGLDEEAPLTPWLRQALSEEERARALERLPAPARGGFVLFGVGARWLTKRWPARHFAALAERLERERGLASVVAVEPGEPPAPELEGLTPLAVPVRELAAAASHARAIVSNDSGVLHLGPALGIPAVGVFGGTVPELGFARQAPRDEAVGIELACRPCSVHGRDRCPLGHHDCMERLSPGLVLEALERAS